jgi:hypothetical protein
MADDKKTEKTDKKTKTEKAAEAEQAARGERGELGTATDKLTITQLWHAAHFTRKDANDKGNFRKRIWVANPGPKVSLKRFARELAKSGNAVAKEWFANKAGAKNAKRLDKNATRISLEKQASKAARRKKSQGKQGKAADATATAAAATTKGKK